VATRPSEPARDERHDAGLDRDQPGHAITAGAERHPDRDLVRPSRRARDLDPGDVRTGNAQDDERHAHQHADEDRPLVGIGRRQEGERGQANSGGLVSRSGKCRQNVLRLRLGLALTESGGQPANHAGADDVANAGPRSSHDRGSVVRIRPHLAHRQPDLPTVVAVFAEIAGIDANEARRQHANHFVCDSSSMIAASRVGVRLSGASRTRNAPCQSPVEGLRMLVLAACPGMLSVVDRYYLNERALRNDRVAR
jgi:hypothetical protein